MAAPADSNVTPDAHSIHQADGRPDRPTAPQPKRITNLFADQSRHAHPDLHTRQARLVPRYFRRPILGPEIHKVGFEVLAPPLLCPHSQYVANVSFGSRVGDVEYVIFL